MTVHLVSSPTVTNVTAATCPASWRVSGSGSLRRNNADATSVSRTTTLTSRRGGRGTNRRGTPRTPHRRRTDPPPRGPRQNPRDGAPADGSAPPWQRNRQRAAGLGGGGRPPG